MDDAISRLVSARQQAELATNQRDKQIAAAEVAKKELLHTATNTARASNETGNNISCLKTPFVFCCPKSYGQYLFFSAEAGYNAAKEVIDAELYAKRKENEIVGEMIDAYKLSFPTASDYQIMEMVKK